MFLGMVTIRGGQFSITSFLLTNNGVEYREHARRISRPVIIFCVQGRFLSEASMGRTEDGLEQIVNGEEQPGTSQFHVLAVDDSIVDRKVIERLLKISAYKVTTVESGRRALEFLGLDEQQDSSVKLDSLEVKVNMIITDYCMPGMTGYDLLKKIKESSTLKEIPVVIMSSENVLARIDRCLEEGAEEFILKPVKLADVKRLKDHIVKGLTKEQVQEQQQLPTSSSKRKAIAENLENIQEQPSNRRPRLGELTVA